MGMLIMALAAHELAKELSERIIYLENLTSKYGWDIVNLQKKVESLELEVKNLKKKY